MIRRPTRSTRTDTLFPYTTLFRSQLAKGGISEADFKATLDRVRLTTDTAEFRDAGLVIEAATENEEIKNRIFADLGPKLSADTVIATKTSSISITRLGAQTDRPDRFVGLHLRSEEHTSELKSLMPTSYDFIRWKDNQTQSR